MPPGWTTTRARILARDHHRCRLCGAPATQVDHITRGTEADANLQSLCGPCHADKTQAEARQARQLA